MTAVAVAVPPHNVPRNPPFSRVSAAMPVVPMVTRLLHAFWLAVLPLS